MSGEILDQSEIDALLHGVDSGQVSTEPPPAPGEAREYDFGRSSRIVRGRMPTLEMINERFARLLRTSLYGLVRRSAAISVGSVRIAKFAEYIRALQLPTSLNLVKLNPLRGTALLILDPQLVFALVDIFFGGKGRHAKIEGREFTPIETRLIQSVLDAAFANLREAWSHVVELSIEHVSSEMNPHFANIVSPTEIVVATRFGIEIDGHGGDFHVTMPYSMIEPLREILEAGLQSDRADRDDRWSMAMREELESADVELRALLGRTTITMAELLKLKAGDVLATDFAGSVVVFAEDVPILKGTLGTSRGQSAVKVSQTVGRGRKAAGGLEADRGGLRP